MKIGVLFSLKEVVNYIFYFPLPIFWLLLITLFLVNKARKLFALKIIMVVFYICLTPVFSFLLEYPLTRSDHFNYDIEKYSAVLVPTAGIYKDVNFEWHPSSNSVLRAKLGEKVAKKYNLPLIISGGKIDLSGKSESETVVDILNYKNLIIENFSRNTYETAKNINDLYRRNNLNKELYLLLVTSPKHSLRMALSLKKQGFKVKKYIYESKKLFNFRVFLPDARTISANNTSMYEYIGIIYYFFKGYI